MVLPNFIERPTFLFKIILKKDYAFLQKVIIFIFISLGKILKNAKNCKDCVFQGQAYQGQKLLDLKSHD